MYLKPRIVFFGESLSKDVLSKAIEDAKRSDVFVVVGSSLQVYPAASLPIIAKVSGAKLVMINRDPTDVDQLFDIVVHGKAGEILPRIVEIIKEII